MTYTIRVTFSDPDVFETMNEAPGRNYLNTAMKQSTQNSRLIKAAAESVYKAFSTPEALEAWLAPGDMTGKVHEFDFKIGGGYKMSLFYPATGKEMTGKTAADEDRFSSQFVELIPNKKIVQAINFESDDANFAGEMIMEVTFESMDNGTNVTFLFKNIPKGIKPEDNEAGTLLTLEKLASYVE